MKLVIMLSMLAIVVCACVTTEIGPDGNPITRDPPETELVIDEHSRIIAKPSRITPPDTIIVNEGTPTERTIKLLGLEGVPKEDAPRTFETCAWWLKEFVAPAMTIYIRFPGGTDLDQNVIYGEVLLDAVDEETGRPIPDGYVSVNQAMLSWGLVRIANPEAIKDEDMLRRMRNAEAIAKREKRGLWSNDP